MRELDLVLICTGDKNYGSALKCINKNVRLISHYSFDLYFSDDE